MKSKLYKGIFEKFTGCIKMHGVEKVIIFVYFATIGWAKTRPIGLFCHPLILRAPQKLTYNKMKFLFL